jgi:hypothetical protein
MIDKEKWDRLIEEHYLSACKRISDYENKHTREEMKEYWYKMVNEKSEKNIEEFIIGSTNSNNKGYLYHPV